MTDISDPAATPPASAEVVAESPPPSAPAERHRARRIISMVLVVLAAIMIPIATTAVWATRTALNTDKFTATVDDVLSDPGVLSVVSNRVTNEVFDALANSSVVENLPPVLKPAVAIVEGALRSRVEESVDNVLTSDTGQEILQGAVKRAHARAMSLLQGDGLLSGSALTIENGTVTLDLRSVIRQVLLRLQSNGVLPDSIQIPAEGEPPSGLAAAIGARLPENFGEIVVYQTDAAKLDGTLEQAQRALVILKRAVVLLVILALAIAVVAVLVAVDHRRAIYRVGLGVTIGAVILIVIARRIAKAVPNAAQTTGGRTIATALADALRSSLVRSLLILALVAAVIAIVARTWHLLSAWIATHADIARIVTVGLGLLILILLGWSWSALIFAVVVAGLGLLLVQRLSAGRQITA
jgi:hypothetical protein